MSPGATLSSLGVNSRLRISTTCSLGAVSVAVAGWMDIDIRTATAITATVLSEDDSMPILIVNRIDHLLGVLLVAFEDHDGLSEELFHLRVLNVGDESALN